MTHRISGNRADAQICEEIRTMAKATDGTALKRLVWGVYTSHRAMYGCHCETLIELTLVYPISKSLENIKKISNLKGMVLCRFTLTLIWRKGQYVLYIQCLK